MARGVSQNFLDIARREQRLGQRAAILAVALAPVAAFLAELADVPGFGPVWTLFVVAVVLGLAAGYVLTQRRLARYEGDLKLRWNHWMQHAANAERVAEVERRVHERDPLPAGLGSWLAVALALLNVLLFALLWVAHPAAEPMAYALLGLDGLVLGALVTSSALLTRWARDFVRSAEDMVRHGELAMWGER